MLFDDARDAIFVGRTAELARIQSAVEAAAAGRPSVIALAGEPGIGKSALCEQVIRFAESIGGRALVGHCYAERSFAPPYLPFIEALRASIAESDAAEVLAEIGTHALDLTWLLPDLTSLFGLQPPPAGDLEDDQWQMFQAVVEFARAASSRKPTLLVLEDIHDADRGTLDLLLHLARNLANARLTILATYRDIAVDRTHPLASTLTDLQRMSHVHRIPLHGLTAEEVHTLYCRSRTRTAVKVVALVPRLAHLTRPY